MRTVVGVLRGGPSSEYEVSLKSGATVLEALDKEKYDARDIFISRDGVWHVHGVPQLPEKALRGIDVAFNVIHGEYGEDGQLQRILEATAVPYTGSDAFASTLAFNKHSTKDIVSKLGIKVAHGVLLDQADDIEQTALSLFRSFPHPAIVKPAIGGSSVGISIVHTFHDLEPALAKAFRVSPKVLVEEFIKGKEATVGVIDNFRGEKTYALLPVEIIPPKKHGFFSYDAKYSGETTERVPGNFTPAEKEQLMHHAKAVHEGVGASHYSRSDFIISKRGIYFLEINNAAGVGMTSESIFPKAVAAVGAKLSDFLDHIITLAMKGRKG
ncbi:MAG: D-alanine--D-alanine ligase [Candidatus Adlerbacteria bacterium]|nr:D-alanine--D-alanine ligase [Candidatus Adlerbacteria bacterium]